MPMLHMVKTIWKQLIKRIVNRIEHSKKCFDDVLPPNIQGALSNIMKNGRGLSLLQCREFSFEVFDGNMSYIVDLESMSCDCGF